MAARTWERAPRSGWEPWAKPTPGKEATRWANLEEDDPEFMEKHAANINGSYRDTQENDEQDEDITRELHECMKQKGFHLNAPKY